jgi:hypothetical protein
MNDNAKLEKIQKCLRLSKSANSNEASIALRHAQKLMEELGIDEDSLEKMGYGNTTVDHNVHAGKTTPIQLNCLVNLISKAFGVKAICERKYNANSVGWRVRYFGSKNRLPTAQYAHQVICRSMEQAWSSYSSANPGAKNVKGYRSSFQTGWLAEISTKVEAIGFTDKEQEIVDNLIAVQYGNNLVTRDKVNKVYTNINNAGREAAKNFEIHRPMDGKSQLAIGA